MASEELTIEQMTIEELKEFQEKSLYKKRCLSGGACIIGFLALLLMYLTLNKMGSDGALIFTLLLVAGTSSIIGCFLAEIKLNRAFTRLVKEYIVEAAAEGMFDSFSYDPDSGFSKSAIDDADMAWTYENILSDDMMIGEFNDVKFYRGDVQLINYPLGEKTAYCSWTMYSFPKPFTYDLQLTTEGMFDQSQVNRSFFTKKSKKRHLFTTGDPEFDSIFACSGQNEQEAMTLLTPAIRKRLIRLYRDVNLPMIIGWKDNTLHFIVQNAYVPFGYELNRTIDYKAEIAEMRKKLLLTRRVVDELIMSRSIFSEYALEEYSYNESTGFDGGLQRQ